MKAESESGSGFVYPEKLLMPSGCAFSDPLNVGDGLVETYFAKKVFHKLLQRPPPSRRASRPTGAFGSRRKAKTRDGKRKG